MMLAALIFDVDGTLAETEEAHRAAFNRCFLEAGLDWHWSQADYAKLLKVTGGKERMQHHRDACGSGPCDDQIAALHRRKTAIYGDIIHGGGLALRPGIDALMGSARAAGLKLAVATTTSRANVDALTRACWGRDAAHVFDVIAAGDEVPRKKPAPDVYDLALSRLGLPPDQCIALEDSRNGLVSAKGAGLRVLVVPATYTQDETHDEADWQARSYNAADLPADLRFAG
ncbi:HAD-IA family hydrolase [Pseudoprimorskyibacter insulae]|uniref:Phosphorylated carbohydrates phosphatase n=1 Tax=Pseudoprimorskyibacter insulae TaxID=1695997 RepID=A0A2R8AUD4_9RHOB|nr:HAD-IA family hydrolase [Pseudoprimorskyibacter insulae]SPF79499.1 Phosphorylated carbohydrates phosphatase [Pseudoprimorskyibacter insulae]